MYLESINGLDDLIKETDLYKSKKGSYKNLLIDKTNLIVSTIINTHKRKGLTFSEPTPLHSDILRELIGWRYVTDIITILIRLDIIKKDNSYVSSTTICRNNFSSKKPESKKYSITQKGLELGIVEVGVLTKNIKKKIEGFRDKNYKKLLRHPLHKKILFGLSDICLDIEACEKVVDEVKKGDNLDRIMTYESALNTLIRFCGIRTIKELICDPSFYYRVADSGRVYHTICNLPKELRKHITTKSGESLTELDMMSAQPLLLACEYMKLVKSKDDASEGQRIEALRLWKTFFKIDVTKHNGFYYEFANASGFSTDFNDKEAYKSVKQGFMKAMYKQNWLETEHSKALEKVFPNFYNYIQDIKQYNYKNAAFIGQSAEADIFIDNYFSSINRSTTSIPVHDSILVPESNASDAHLILAKGINKRYNFISIDCAMIIINKETKKAKNVDDYHIPDMDWW